MHMYQKLSNYSFRVEKKKKKKKERNVCFHRKTSTAESEQKSKCEGSEEEEAAVKILQLHICHNKTIAYHTFPQPFKYFVSFLHVYIIYRSLQVTQQNPVAWRKWLQAETIT